MRQRERTDVQATETAATPSANSPPKDPRILLYRGTPQPYRCTLCCRLKLCFEEVPSPARKTRTRTQNLHSQQQTQNTLHAHTPRLEQRTAAHPFRHAQELGEVGVAGRRWVRSLIAL